LLHFNKIFCCQLKENEGLITKLKKNKNFSQKSSKKHKNQINAERVNLNQNNPALGQKLFAHY